MATHSAICITRHTCIKDLNGHTQCYLYHKIYNAICITRYTCINTMKGQGKLLLVFSPPDRGQYVAISQLACLTCLVVSHSDRQCASLRPARQPGRTLILLDSQTTRLAVLNQTDNACCLPQPAFATLYLSSASNALTSMKPPSPSPNLTPRPRGYNGQPQSGLSTPIIPSQLIIRIPS